MTALRFIASARLGKGASYEPRRSVHVLPSLSAVFVQDLEVRVIDEESVPPSAGQFAGNPQFRQGKSRA